MTLVLAARRQIGHALGRAAGGLSWLLRDDFTTDLAAGSVDGTAAEPGPGTRVTVETSGSVAIASGQAAVTGANSYTSPVLYWSGAIGRTPGRLAILSAGNSLGVDNNAFGFTASPTAAWNSSTVKEYWRISRSDFRPNNLVTSQIRGTVPVAIILRATGAFFLAKLSTTWTLHWISASDATATLYIGTNIYNSGVTTYCQYVRVPDILWLPTPLASDGFGSTFGTTDGLGHAEGIAGGIGAGGGGVAWSNVGSTWSVSGGKAKNTPNLGSNVVVNGTFDTDTDWTKGAGWLIGSGVATKTASAGSSLSETVRSTTPKQWYKATFTVAGAVANGVYALGFYDFLKAAISPGTYSQTGFASSSTNAGVFANINTANITVDNIGFQPMTLPELMTSFDASTADVLASVHITWTNTTQAGIVLRANSSTLPTDFILVLLNTISNSACIQVIKCLAGTYAVVSTTGVTYLANAPLTVGAHGSGIRVYYNNAFIVAVTISDAGIVNNTLHGMFSTNASNTLDNFTCYATGTGGEYATLDQYIQ